MTVDRELYSFESAKKARNKDGQHYSKEEKRESRKKIEEAGEFRVSRA